MKRTGLHWAIQAQIARRGGFLGTKILTAPEIDGFVLSIRNSEHANLKAKREPRPNSNQATGGYFHADLDHLPFGDRGDSDLSVERIIPISRPPGLGEIDHGTPKYQFNAYRTFSFVRMS